MDKDNIIINDELYVLKKVKNDLSDKVPFVSANEVDVKEIKIEKRDHDAVAEVLKEVQSGDICTLIVDHKTPSKCHFGSLGTGVITRLEDGNVLFCGEYYKTSEIVNIILKKKCNTNYDDRRLSQEEVKKTCKNIFDKYYDSRLKFLLSRYNYRFEIDKMIFDESDSYVNDILTALIGDEARQLPKAMQYKKDEYYSYFNAPLIQYFGDSYQTRKIVGIVNNYIDRYNQLCNKSLQWFYDDNKESFINNALTNLMEFCENGFLDEYEKQEAISEIRQLDNIEDIIKLIYTFMFSVSALKSYKDMDFIDYTYISVSLFKLTELVFNKMLTKYWGDTKIISAEENKKAKEEDRDPHYIDLSNSKLVLGAMEQFFNSINNDVQRHLAQKSRYRDEIKVRLRPWIKDDRNGFLHKDIQNQQELESCIESTFILMFIIVLAIKR